MNNVQLRRGQEQQRRAHLLRKLPRQVQRHTAEGRVSQKVVEIVGEKLEDQTEMVAEHEVTFEFDCKRKRGRNIINLNCWWFLSYQLHVHCTSHSLKQVLSVINYSIE